MLRSLVLLDLHPWLTLSSLYLALQLPFGGLVGGFCAGCSPTKSAADSWDSRRCFEEPATRRELNHDLSRCD